MDSPNGTEPPASGGPKRRRRRRRGPRKSEGKPSDEAAESRPERPHKRDGAAPGRNRRGRGRRSSKRAGVAAKVEKVLAKAAEPIDLETNLEQPLTEQEVAVLRDHFRFLREHRKDLKLKVNANEDLLLNGVREPVHRGVCHHLLSKVERKNVLAAAERLDPTRAARMLAGIIGFSSDIEYVLLFLEKIQQSSTPAEATAALFQGLARIEFDQVSNAQMRRVLQLIVELFGENERPTLLLGMFESDGFRNAFDKSSEQLPEALAHLVLPLRAVQAVVLHGDANTFDSDALRDGVELLLELDSKILLRHSVEMRQRLFDFGLQACTAPLHRFHDRLAMLARNFPAADPGRPARGIALARHLIAANAETAASKLLRALSNEFPKLEEPTHWLELLDAERVDRFVWLNHSADGADALGRHTRRAAVWLDTMEPVWLQIARSEESGPHRQTLEIQRDIAIPGVAAVLASGSTPGGEPYFVVANSGEPLDRVVAREPGLSLVGTVRICVAAVGVLNALAAVGVRLPDVRPVRFELARGGDLVLTDLAGAERIDPDPSGVIHFEQARALCSDLLGRVRRDIVPSELRSVVTSAASCAQLATELARRGN